ncbi:TPA: 3-deoxy-D-manno-octulosonic acid transferase, partial [Haemophilus influenzae]
MWRFFYTSLLLICQPLILCFIGLISVKSPRYRQRLAERYGFYGNASCPPPQGIFI